MTMTPTLASAISEAMIKQAGTPKRKVFISYHHEQDQPYFDFLSKHFSGNLGLFFDRSLDDRIESNDVDYTHRRIREKHIQGSSITIVLCGVETYKRKWIDWEIHSTLEYKHALLGIRLPNCTTLPNRLFQNYHSGHAHLIEWDHALWESNPLQFIREIETAVFKSSIGSPTNNLLQMARNRS